MPRQHKSAFRRWWETQKRRWEALKKVWEEIKWELYVSSGGNPWRYLSFENVYGCISGCGFIVCLIIGHLVFAAVIIKAIIAFGSCVVSKF